MRHALAPGSEVGGYRIECAAGRGRHRGRLSRRRCRGAHGRAEGARPGLADGRPLPRAVPARERASPRSCEHPSIVPVLDAGEDDGVLFLAMEWVDGSDLRDLLRREGALEPERAVALIEDVAAGLDEAHAAGADPPRRQAGEHPRGRRRGRALCDFGLAKHTARAESLTGERMLVGTLAYIAPEQIEGAGVDARADVYALGCVLYECLTGEPPFDRDSELAVLYAHLNEPPPRPSARRPELPAAFDDVVATALAKAPADRPRELRRAGARGARRAARRGAAAPRRRRGALVAAPRPARSPWPPRRPSSSARGSDDPPARPGLRVGADALAAVDAGTRPARRAGSACRPGRTTRSWPGAPRGCCSTAAGALVRVDARSRRVVGVARAPVPAGRDGGGRRRALGRGGGRTARRADRGAQRPRGAHAARAARRRATPARSRSAPARSGSAADPRSCASPPLGPGAGAAATPVDVTHRAVRRRRGLGGRARRKGGSPRSIPRRTASSRATSSTAGSPPSPSAAASRGSASCPTTWCSS